MYRQSQSISCVFPENSKIGHVDVSGLDINQAKSKLMETYEKPIEIQANEQIFLLTNEQLGIQNDYDSWVSNLNCLNVTPREKFWTYIWKKTNQDPVQIEILIVENEEVIIKSIDQVIVPIVEIEPIPYVPISGSTMYQSGRTGKTINKESLIADIKFQVQADEKRIIQAEIIENSAEMPSMEQIRGKIKDMILAEGFNGVVELYAQNISNGEVLQLLNWYGEEKPPGVAFTAASTMKIPIMLSTYWRQDLPLNEMTDGWIEYMIVYSENDPADRLMEQIDFVRGPLLVTSDLETMGFKNTFIAGYFYLGAPLLNLYQTPANQRSDTNINPDVYNQTTPEEIGKLLGMIYSCSQNDSSELVQISQGQIKPEECVQIIDILSRNKMGALIEAGLPEGLKIAHKHGWSQERDGLVHSFSDVGIIFGPQNDFILTIFLYSPNQLLFDKANPLIAKISQSIYNGLNPNNQISWPLPDE
jgi:beta-lactamase class A